MDTHREPPHYLTKLKTTTTPKRMVWLDCSTASTNHHGLTVQRFEQAAVGTTHYAKTSRKRVDTLSTYDDPADVWQAIDKFCTKSNQVVLFAHDLAQQIRTSQAMVQLPLLGWTLDSIVLERTSSWAKYSDGSRSLVLCDLQSWAPVPLGIIGSDVTKGNVKILDIDAGPAFHVNLCRARAMCVRDAMLEVFAWVEGENLGRFKPTGAGQSYSAFRRRFMTHNLLVHDDPARLHAERVAMWTGRCEAWRHGNITGSPFVEYDMQAAYCHVARDCEVPAVAMPPMRVCTVPMVKRAMAQYSVLAHVTVNTDVPCLPTRVGGRTAWPVGEFSTWLWDPELSLAFQYCNTVKVHTAYRYRREPALAEFAAWVLDGLGAQTQVYGLVPRRVAKHWSRCLVGRLGLRYRGWQKFATSPDIDLRLVKYIDTEEGIATDLLIAGHEWLLLGEMAEATESLPQIPSWVMSECRRRLWVAMVQAGKRLVYVDTDSVIMSDDGAAGAWRVSASNLTNCEWTQKGTYTRMTVHGPRNLVCETDRRISGVPLTARQTAPLEFTGQVMRSLKDSMRAGELDCVTSIPRNFVLDAPDLRRQHLSGGGTEPFTVQPTQPQEDDLWA